MENGAGQVALPPSASPESGNRNDQSPHFAFGFSRYQATVLLAAWLGWGFDVYDGLLFNYIAANCIPTLLHIPIGSKLANERSVEWVGLLTSLLLVGWAVGGIVFGKVADRLGRSRTLLITMLLYSVGTAACAFAPNIGALIVFRIVSSLGIGGEWAAGAAIVSEVVPENRRVEAGALLYTASAMGLFLATFVNKLIAGYLMVGRPDLSWRYIFATGLIGAAVAFLVRSFVREPERWKAAGEKAQARITDLFTRQHLHATLSGLSMAVVALITWWSCNAFIPVVAKLLAGAKLASDPALAHMSAKAVQQFKEGWVATATYSFNWGGIIGTLLTIPAAKLLGRKVMFFTYFLLATCSVFGTFSPGVPAEVRLHLYFFIGLTVFGVFGSFTYYLPELFPTRLRGTGAGFCYNAGRFAAAFGPIVVSHVSKHGLPAVLHALFLVGFVPLAGLLAVPFVKETRGGNLDELDESPAT